MSPEASRTGGHVAQSRVGCDTFDSCICDNDASSLGGTGAHVSASLFMNQKREAAAFFRQHVLVSVFC